MTKKKITLEDFAKSSALKAHSTRSKAVARALDEQADSLPYSKVFTSFEFEDFLAQLTPKHLHEWVSAENWLAAASSPFCQASSVRFSHTKA